MLKPATAREEFPDPSPNPQITPPHFSSKLSLRENSSSRVSTLYSRPFPFVTPNRAFVHERLFNDHLSRDSQLTILQPQVNFGLGWKQPVRSRPRRLFPSDPRSAVPFFLPGASFLLPPQPALLVNCIPCLAARSPSHSSPPVSTPERKWRLKRQSRRRRSC